MVSRWPKSFLLVSRSPFWYQDSAFCCSASRSSSSWDEPVRVFGPRHPVHWRSKEDLDTEKKIENLDAPKNNSMPAKKSHPIFAGTFLGRIRGTFRGGFRGESLNG